LLLDQGNVGGCDGDREGIGALPEGARKAFSESLPVIAARISSF
jgi:hypothetical protein